VDYYSKVPGEPSALNVTYIVQNRTLDYLFSSAATKPIDMHVTVYTSTTIKDVSSCTLTVTTASRNNPHSSHTFQLQPTASRGDFVANEAALPFGPGLNVLRLQAVGTDANCAVFNPKNNQTVLTMEIGAINIVAPARNVDYADYAV
jgi:hypothetical protein